MKKRTALAVSILAATWVIAGWATTGATSPSWGPEPGFIGQATYTGIPAPGAILEVTWRFSIPADALGAVYLDSLKENLLRSPNDQYLKVALERPDSVHVWADTSIEFLGPISWSGSIEPGREYTFATTIRLKSGKLSQVYLGFSTRYGVQGIRGLAFFTGKSPHPVGYVTRVIVDSLGNYWHKHLAVVDSTLEGFVPFEPNVGLPPDTSFDKTGKVLLILQVMDSINSKFRPHGTPPKLQPGINHIQQKPSRKSSKDGSLGMHDNGTTQETERSRRHSTSTSESQGASYTMTGVFQYQHAVTSQFEPIPFATIQVFYKNIFGNWVFQFNDFTSSDGSFDVSVDETEVLLLILADNPLVRVFNTDTHSITLGGSVIVYWYSLGLSNPAQVDISLDTLFIPNETFPVTRITRIPAPYHIAARIFETGLDPLFIHTGEVLTQPAWVFWDSLNTANAGGSNFGAFAVNGTNGIYINNKDATSPCNNCNMDEWDNAVIIHEFSHYLTWVYTEIPPFAFGSHNIISRPAVITLPNGTKNRPLDLSFNEAVASLLGGVLLGTSSYTDSISGFQLAIRGILGDWERPLPDSPWKSAGGDWHLSTDESIDYPGEVSEGGILNILWDLFDAPDDGDYFQGSVKFGHNDDFNSGSSYVGFQAIWDVLKNWDPQPLNDQHDHPWNMYEFVAGWKAKGYPVDQTFLDILASHGVPMFVAGNVDGMGNVNIGDVTKLIDLIFHSNPYPDPQAQGDVNADCSVDIADVTYMIAWMFSGGPNLLVGCVAP
jgi:hypothetical protein